MPLKKRNKKESARSRVTRIWVTGGIYLQYELSHYDASFLGINVARFSLTHICQKRLLPRVVLEAPVVLRIDPDETVACCHLPWVLVVYVRRRGNRRYGLTSLVVSELNPASRFLRTADDDPSDNAVAVGYLCRAIRRTVTR